MKTVFLNGWGLSTSEAQEALEQHGVSGACQVIALETDCVEQCGAAVGEQLIAYSTGAFLALREPQLLLRFKQVILLAPFFDFRSESGLGGKVRTAQLKYLLRWLAKEPLAAVNDFRIRAGLGGEPLSELPASQEDLQWGIERLLKDAVKTEPARENLRGYVGGADALLDAKTLSSSHSWIKSLPGVGHDLPGLLQATEVVL